MLATIDEKINAVIRDTTHVLNTPKPIQMGSDAYLDKVLYHKKLLDGLNDRQVELNEILISAFNEDREDALTVIPKLKKLHVVYINVINNYKTGILANALTTALENARIEVSQLREIIDDFQLTEKIKSDNSLQSLFQQL